MSGYSIDGWKYMRKTFIEMAKKYNVDIKEKAIEYITDWDDEKRKLYNQSKKDIRDRYGKKWSDELGYWNIDESFSTKQQQPFFLKYGRLYISDNFAKYITKDLSGYLKSKRDDFFSDIKKHIHIL